MSGPREPLRERARWKLEAGVARVLGRTVRCAECGGPLFKALPVTWRGKLVLVGLRIQEPLVRVRFAERDRLEFVHGELDLCPARERPWARRAGVWPS